MNLEPLYNTTKEARRLEGENVENNVTYLLSEKHLNIIVRSENTTKPEFTWHASNITNSTIVI
jgi:hypothetical protein